MFEIGFDQRDLERVLHAIEKVHSAVILYVYDELPLRLARQYKLNLIEAMVGEDYAEGYAPYHPRYKNWKSEYAAGSFWVLFGDLIRALGIHRIERGRFCGVKSSVMDRGGKSWFGHRDKGKPKPIAMYGWIMELGGDYGTGGDHPARPVFEPALDDFAREEAPRIGEKALEEIGRQWS